MPHARTLSHIRVYRKRARPLREKWQKEYMRESLTEYQLAKRGARFREDTSQGGACLPDGKAMQDTYGCPDKKSTAKAPDRLCLWMMHSVVAKIKRMAGTLRKEREGILN